MENVDNFLGKLTYGFDRIESIVMEALGLWLKFDQFRSALRDLFSVGSPGREVALQQAGRVPAKLSARLPGALYRAGGRTPCFLSPSGLGSASTP